MARKSWLLFGICAIEAALTSSLTCKSAFSADVHLEQLQPSMDTSTPAIAPAKPPSALLNGNVSKEEAGAPPVTGNDVPSAGGIFINGIKVGEGAMTGAQLKEAIQSINASHPGLLLRMGGRAAPFSGLNGRAKLSTEDYRKMQYGVVGMVSRMTDGPPVVINVFPTCPAVKAGIRPGDMVVKVGNRVLRASQGQYIFWKTVAGKADTPVDVTVLRDGNLIPFHMIRMNIEDIEDVKIRRDYERMLSIMGPPTGGMDSQAESVGNALKSADQSDPTADLTEMTGLEGAAGSEAPRGE